MNILNEYFDKIYCINLDRRPDRWEECQVIFKSMGLDVERFSACDGQLIDSGYGKVYNGELGGTIAHTRLIKKVKDEKLDKVLILEDDIEFCKDFDEKFTHAVKDLPEDWDMFFFGGNHTGGFQMITENIGRVFRTLALHSYAIRGKSASYLYQNMIQFVGHSLCANTQLTPSVAADYWMAMTQPNLNCYSIFPNLTWQRESFSDLQQDVMNYEFLK